MESSGLQCDTMTHPTELLIACTNADSQLGEPELDLEEDSQQQISALTEQYHFIDQDGNTFQYEIQDLSGTSPQMMILTSESENGQVYHVNVIPSNQTTAQLLIPQEPDDHNQPREPLPPVQSAPGHAVPNPAGSVLIHSDTALDASKTSPVRLSVEQFPKPLQRLPPNIPVWARRLRNCEKIGDSYRGYCLSEAELMNILGLHKQHTMSVWGTRQSPSPAKPATRLMWKSQYVPYDGIPFINAGSRAIVMECQYGPRRKGSQPKKSGESEIPAGPLYKATCPARIYIKKVKKFPAYRVPTDPKIDKKLIKLEQEKAFNFLKKDLEANEGVLRWYVQLPDQEAHQYHNLDTGCFSSSPSPFQPPNEEDDELICDDSALSSRLHPYVAEKIRELVARGIDEVYAVRKQLRKFVERELFKPDEIPERHNLSYFPTVNDLKNHIHEAQKALGNGELICDQETIPRPLQWSSDSGGILNEMVTVTFESSSREEHDSLIKVQNSSNEDDCQDTAQLISSLTSLQPKIFAQLQSLQLQSSFTSPDGTTALIAVNQPSSPFTSDETAALITVNPQTPSFATSDGTTTLIAVNHESPSFTASSSLIAVRQPGLLNAGTSSQPLVLGHLQSQQNEATLSAVTSHNHLVSMGQLVTVEDPISSMAGEVHQILLGELHPIPIAILDHQPTIVEVGSVEAYCTEQGEDNPGETTENQVHTDEAEATDCEDPA
ncbi:calcium-responsive transcription factor [Dendrobates tinctorius]|uniref:calcium-responsive transcription factor n=1 Tax=Dendrobates tinctorius TaxID=92724 RepID=UPI003CCA3F2A